MARSARRRFSPVPDATGLELIRQEVGSAVLDTIFFPERATLVIEPEAIRSVLAPVRQKGYSLRATVNGADARRASSRCSAPTTTTSTRERRDEPGRAGHQPAVERHLRVPAS